MSETNGHPEKFREPPQKQTPEQKTMITKIKDATKAVTKKIKDHVAEKAGIRGILIYLIIIGIIIFAIGLILITANNIEMQHLYQMNTLGLIGGTEYNYLMREIYIKMYRNEVIGQIGAIITALFLIIAAISPISSKDKSYFSEHTRLGLIAFAAVMIYVATQL